MEGPSRHLPAGSDLVDLHLDPVKESYRVFATDRRDFYHQFWVTPEKARENAVGPRVRLQDLRGLEEYDRFTKGQTFRKSPATSRETVGDRLHDDHGVFFFKPRPVLTEDVHVCFLFFRVTTLGWKWQPLPMSIFCRPVDCWSRVGDQ